MGIITDSLIANQHFSSCESRLISPHGKSWARDFDNCVGLWHPPARVNNLPDHLFNCKKRSWLLGSKMFACGKHDLPIIELFMELARDEKIEWGDEQRQLQWGTKKR